MASRLHTQMDKGVEVIYIDDVTKEEKTFSIIGTDFNDVTYRLKTQTPVCIYGGGSIRFRAKLGDIQNNSIDHVLLAFEEYVKEKGTCIKDIKLIGLDNSARMSFNAKKPEPPKPKVETPKPKTEEAKNDCCDELAKLQEKSKQDEEEIANLKQNQKFKDLEKNNQELNAKIDELNKRLEEKNKEIEKLKEDHEEQIKNKDTALTKKDEELKKKDDEINLLKQQINKCNTDYKNLEEQFNSKKGEQSDSQKQIVNLNIINHKLEVEVTNLKVEVTNLQVTINQYKITIQTLKDDKKKLEEDKKELKSEVENLKSDTLVYSKPQDNNPELIIYRKGQNFPSDAEYFIRHSFDHFKEGASLKDIAIHMVQRAREDNDNVGKFTALLSKGQYGIRYFMKTSTALVARFRGINILVFQEAEY